MAMRLQDLIDHLPILDLRWPAEMQEQWWGLYGQLWRMVRPAAPAAGESDGL